MEMKVGAACTKQLTIGKKESRMSSQEQVPKEDSHWKVKKRVGKYRVSMAGTGEDVSMNPVEESTANVEYSEVTMAEHMANIIVQTRPRGTAERERTMFCWNCKQY